MQGDLRTTSLEQLCRTLDERAASGELVIRHDSEVVNVWFRQGRVVRALSPSHQMRLGDRLVHGGLIDPAELQQALTAQKTSGKPLGEVLVTEGLVNRHVVKVFTQEQVLDSLFAAIRWTGGDYEFIEDEIEEPSVPSDLTVAQLLFALESRHRMWDEITRTIPDLAAIPEVVPGADPSSAHLEQGEAAVVKGIDGRSSLEQIAERLGFGPYEVATVVHGLAVLGMVRLSDGASTPPSAAAAPSPAPADPPAPAAGAPGSALSEATALLLGDDDDLGIQLDDLADLADLGAPADTPAPPAPEPATPPPAEPVAQPVAQPAEPVARAVDPTPTPTPTTSSTDDDDDVAPWAFTIEGDDDESSAPASPRRVSTPITAGGVEVKADAATGMPLPEPSATPPPAPPAPAAAAESAAAEASSDPAEPARPRTGEMSDLLRELRQLSGE